MLDEDGQALTEYAIVLACIVLAVLASMRVMGTLFSEQFQRQHNALNRAR